MESPFAGAARTVPNTLLIVDDEKANRTILANLFADVHAIEKAESGQAALRRILAQPHDYCALLLDVAGNEADGFDVLEQLRRTGLSDQIPVFFITEHTDSSLTEKAYELGVMDVIRKPIVPYVVRRRVESIIELFQARKRLSYVVEDQRSELLRRAERIIELNRGMIESLSAAIEFRDGESGGHVHRIHDVTKLMLMRTDWGKGLSAQEIDEIALASIMHDIGKIAIPDAILNKPGRLTPEEFEVMKTHTVQGEMLLSHIPQLKDTGVYTYARDIARHHHERWDGTGYPDGLKGDEISPWAQIVSLADVYDALTSKRVYKEAFSREESLRMIEEGECGAFNPRLLESFLEIEPEINQLYEALRERERERENAGTASGSGTSGLNAERP